MALQLSPYTAPLAIVVVLDLLLAGLSLSRRDQPGAVSLAAMMLAVGSSTAAYAVMLNWPTLLGKLALMRASYVGMALIPVAWLYFAVQFTGRERWATWKTTAVLSVEPAVLTAMMLTPPSWGLVNESYRMVTLETGRQVLAFTPGIWMAVHFSYHYIVFGIGTLLFVSLFIRSRHLYRAQAGAMLAGALIPWAGNALYLTGLFDRVHPFPFLLTLSGIAFTMALYRFRLLDPVPTARKAIVEEMGDGVLVLDGEGRVGDANPAARRLLTDGGYYRAGVGNDGSGASNRGESLTGRPVETLIDGWERIAASEDQWHEVAVLVGTDRRYLEVEVTSFEDHHDRDVGRLVVIRNVTQRKRREKTLARYKTIFESVGDRVYVLDADDRFTMVNDPFAELLGYRSDELIGEHVSTIVASGEVEDDETSSFETGRRHRFELSARTADGEVIPCETELSPIAFDEATEGTVGVIRDISRRREAERSLRETSHRLRTLVEASPLAILSLDAGGQVEVWNPAAERIFGWSPDDVEGARPPFVPEGEDETFAAVETQLLSGETVTGTELELATADGDHIDASISGAPIHSLNQEQSAIHQRSTADADEVTGAVVVIADVTDRKDRERRLRRQNEKLEQFASMLSHDLRNPLSVAKGFTGIARNEDDPDAFERIERAHDRMGRIIDDLLQLARQGETVSETEEVALATVARNAWEVVDTGEATLTVDEDRTLRADADRLQEAFENLFRNAREHAGSDATVRVGTTEDGFFVADDGPGIPPEERDEVFEHGYTTATGGTGFGLSIVAEIVEAHGWTIRVTDSERAAGGARFEVDLTAHATDPAGGAGATDLEAELESD